MLLEFTVEQIPMEVCFMSSTEFDIFPPGFRRNLREHDKRVCIAPPQGRTVLINMYMYLVCADATTISYRSVLTLPGRLLCSGHVHYDLYKNP